jgi:hypothetical protein
LWRWANNKPSIVDKAANQQYLAPQEEQALVEYVLRLAKNGYPLPVKFLRSLALVIARQRSSTFQIIDPSLEIRPPGKNWPQGFYLRHPQLKARRLRAIDWKRDDRQIEEKVRHWFTVPLLAVNWLIPPFSGRMCITWTRRESVRVAYLAAF